jgi:hypothetical protein
MNAIVNAAPMVNKLGIKDNSAAQQPVQPPEIPDHLPHVFIWAQKGPTGRQLVPAGLQVDMYGADTFDLRKKYATHQTVLSIVVSGGGNAAQMIERIVPSDAGPKANFLLCLEVLASAVVPVWQRNADGTILTDAAGVPQQQSTDVTAGFKVRWVVKHVTTGGPAVADSTSFGVATSTSGTWTEGETSSTIYPILEFWAGYYGEAGNNEGIRLLAPLSTDDAPSNTSLLGSIQSFVYRLQAIRRKDANTTPKIVNTLDGSTSIDFVLKPGQFDPISEENVSLGDIFKSSYQVLNDPTRQDVWAGIPNLHIYQTNIATLQNLLFQAEQTAMDALSDTVGADFTTTDDVTANLYKYNIFTFRNQAGAQYRGILQDTTTTGTLVLSGATNIYCASGSDGTMDDTAFNNAVQSAMDDYADLTSDAIDTAVNPANIVYDTGFTLATKQSLCQILARRKDTFVVLSTHTEGVTQTAAQEASVGITLRSTLNLYPDSAYFGTPVVRGIVVARYGTMMGMNYPKPLPLTLWLAGKASAMMGAGNGVWNAAKLFDKDPATIVDNFKDLNSTFTPADQRVQDWAVGLNYPIAYSHNQYFFPALKTVFPDDTSVLTSFFTAMAAASLQRVGEQVWREFTGEIRYTRAQLIQNVNKSVIDKVTGKYAGLFRVVPAAFISGGDELRGFSYTLPIQLYANNSTTVMTLSIEANRMPAK